MSQDDTQQEQDITPAGGEDDGLGVSVPERTTEPKRVVGRPFTSASSLAALQRRWSMYRQAAEGGLVAGVRAAADGPITDRAAAWGAIVARQAEAAMYLNNQGMPNTPAAEFVRRSIGADKGAPAAAAAGPQVPQSGAVLALSDGAARALADALARLAESREQNR